MCSISITLRHKGKGLKSYSSRLKRTPITKIRVSPGVGKSKHYQALVHQPNLHAPQDIRYGDGAVWVLFRKKDNPDITFPVLEKGMEHCYE
mgnify:CR=1 FL=1